MHLGTSGLWTLVAPLPTGLWSLAAVGDRSVDPSQHLKAYTCFPIAYNH